jgi:hypothetical protein
MSTRAPLARPAQTPSQPMMIRGIDAAARELGLSPRMISQLVKCDALPHRRVGRAVLFVPDELAAWITAGCPCEAGAAQRLREEGSS